MSTFDHSRPKLDAPVNPHSGRPAVIDTDTLLAHCMGNLEFALTLLSEMAASAPKHVENIDRLLARGELRATSEAAHALKGAAAIVGAEAVRQSAARVEVSAAEGDLQTAAAQAAQLRRELTDCLDEIAQLRARPWGSGRVGVDQNRPLGKR